MKKSQKSMMIVLLSFLIIVSAAGFVFGELTAEEAARLGKNLTLFGAEGAGNADGTIPPYTGGLTTPPDSYKPGSGVYTDPFPEEKPLFSINAKNMNQYADKMPEGAKALMKRYPEYRMDVYKTHRTVAYREEFLKNTAEKYALTAKTGGGGLVLEGARACIPFPIPKTGHEAMWNHITSSSGRINSSYTISAIKDLNGRLTLSGAGECFYEYPYLDENPAEADELYYSKYIYVFGGKDCPPRLLGQIYLAFYPLNQEKQGMLTYIYLPGQRRVRLAPEAEFDTPLPDAAGNTVFDEAFMFMGSMRKYDWKLVGKKEIYIPYNNYRLIYADPDQALAKGYANPDLVRWELHRVWVVEATLKEGERHIYPKRTKYIDEDSWIIHAAELYDAQGALVKADFSMMTTIYYKKTILVSGTWNANLVNGVVHVAYLLGPNGWIKYPAEPLSTKCYSPEAISSMTCR